MSQAILVCGLGFGDEGKGATVDALCCKHDAHTVVRYNGGSQAGHNCVTSDGRHHTFTQFGSGTFAGAGTHLSRYMLVNPIFLLSEGKHLQSIGERDVFDRITVEGDALITNPFQVSANRILEMARGKNRHGSCGMGIGETVADALFQVGQPHLEIHVRDLLSPDNLREYLERSREQKMFRLGCLHEKTCDVANTSWSHPPSMSRAVCSCPFAKEWDVIRDETTIDLAMERYAEFVDRVKIVDKSYLPEAMRNGTTIFEGAQGMLLDQDYGFHPYTTWTDITFRNACDLLGTMRDFSGEVRRIGVLRSYHTRHGAGPFPTEDVTLNHPEPHNGNGPWQQGFRQGHFDLVLARYALEAIGGVDEIALTHLDRIQDEQKVCVGYDYWGTRIPQPDATQAWRRREDLIVREEFSVMVGEYKPVYRTLHYSPEGFVTEIEKLLGVRVGMKAYGPTANDRRMT